MVDQVRRTRAATLCRSVLLHALDKCGVQSPTQAQSLQCGLERRMRSAAQHMRHTHQTPAAIVLLDLAVKQSRSHLPLANPPADTPDPLPKMGRQPVEIVV